jgi:DNA polymerase alpha subunit A
MRGRVFSRSLVCPYHSNITQVPRFDFFRPEPIMASRKARLAELKALRASGKTRVATYEVDDVEKIYEEVNEEDYKKVVRKRLEDDDFVVDDNGEGYADDGREDWQNDPQDEYSESEEEAPARSKAGNAHAP